MLLLKINIAIYFLNCIIAMSMATYRHIFQMFKYKLKDVYIVSGYVNLDTYVTFQSTITRFVANVHKPDVM